MAAVLIASAGGLSGLTATPTRAQAPDPQVSVDDEADAYVGRGGLVLPPGSATEAERRRIADCGDCRWRLTDPCTPDGGACLSVARGCPHGRLLRAWTSADGGRTWRLVGLPCIGAAGPVTVESAGRRLSEEVSRQVKGAEIEHRPPRGILPRLPVRFRPVQVQPGPMELSVLGRQAVVVARPTWAWSFGDGAGGEGASDGGSVAHAYRHRGAYEVRLTTTWQATYTVDGLGPFSLEPLHQQAVLPLLVGSGRAVLVP